MKIDDSKYIVDSIFGKEITFFNTKEKSVMNQFSKDLAKSITSEKYNPNQTDETVQVLSFEEPDLLLVCKDTIYAIEHFRVDSSMANKKGSSYKQKYNKKYEETIDKKINEKLRTNSHAVYTDKISTNLNYENLFENVITNFDNHYAKISNYRIKIKSKLKLESRSIKLIFFIQYEIIFPSFIQKENGKLCNIFPDNDIRFINYCKKKSNLFGAFFNFRSESPDIPSKNRFILFDEENLNDYSVDNLITFDFQKMEVHDFDNPMASKFAFTIKEDTAK